MNELTKLLKEFNIKMDDERERDPLEPEMDGGDDEFDFNISGDDTGEFDTEDEFGDFERDQPDDEFGNFPDMDDNMDDEDLPMGLSDMEDEEGEFNGERKVDITDRLKKMLARQDGTGEEMDDEGEDFNLSDVDDFESPPSPRLKNRDSIRDIDDFEEDF